MENTLISLTGLSVVQISVIGIGECLDKVLIMLDARRGSKTIVKRILSMRIWRR